MSNLRVLPFILASFTSSAFGAVINTYDDFAVFSAQFDGVDVYSQDTANPGTSSDNFNYELLVGPVKIAFEGPAEYSEDFPQPGITVLSKGVPVNLTASDPDTTGGLGLFIYQFAPVDIAVYDQDGAVQLINNYANEFGATGSVFLGFTSSAGILRMEITDPTADGITPITNLGQIVVGAPSVPLPAAAWLFGSALLGLAAMKRRRVSA
jgi:hypothetical protein